MSATTATTTGVNDGQTGGLADLIYEQQQRERLKFRISVIELSSSGNRTEPWRLDSACPPLCNIWEPSPG